MLVGGMGGSARPSFPMNLIGRYQSHLRRCFESWRETIDHAPLHLSLHGIKIHIRDLVLKCIIGINPEERVKRQEVNINITIYADLAQAARSDCMAHTVDYKAIKKQVVALVETSSFFLVERLASGIADVCLAHRRVRAVRVCVEKPGALRYARTVGIELLRRRRVTRR